MEFSIKYFFNFRQICWHLLKKSLIENFDFRTVTVVLSGSFSYMFDTVVFLNISAKSPRNLGSVHVLIFVSVILPNLQLVEYHKKYLYSLVCSILVFQQRKGDSCIIQKFSIKDFLLTGDSNGIVLSSSKLGSFNLL